MEHFNSLFGFLWLLLRKSKSKLRLLSFPVLFSVHWLIVWERKPVQFLSKGFIPVECESSSLLDFKWAITSLLTWDFLAPLCPSSFNSVYLKSLEKLKQRTLNASKSSNSVIVPLLDNVKRSVLLKSHLTKVNALSKWKEKKGWFEAVSRRWGCVNGSDSEHSFSKCHGLPSGPEPESVVKKQARKLSVTWGGLRAS